jgi:hypothetical protein
MSDRRMFSKTIIDSDAFLEMPLSTQSLYFHLSMRADDDGFINNPKRIQKMIGSSEDDLKLLIAKNFIIPFESGVVVIKHWRIHNYIRGDRKKDTVYSEELASLTVKENGAYTLCQPSDNQVTTKCQHRLGKDSIGKDNNNIYISHLDLKYVKLKQEQYDKIKKDYPNLANIDIDNQILMLDEYVTINGNKNKYKDWNLVLRKSIREEWFKKGGNTNSRRKVDVPTWFEQYEKERTEEFKQLDQNQGPELTPEEIKKLGEELFKD